MAYIPNKLYCGFKSESSDSLVAFMTPMAEDAAFTKRKASVDSWRDKSLQVLELDNNPMLGFRFVDTSRRWNSNNVVFRVIHPGAGAEFEISAENLSLLMETCDIIKGEITTKLLLIRDGAKNLLVPENSELHLGSASVDEKGREVFVDKSLVLEGSNVTVKSLGKVVNFGKDQIHTCSLEYINHSRSSYHSYSSPPPSYGVRIKTQTINEFIFLDEENDKVKTLASRPKVMTVSSLSGLTKNDLIGKSFKWYSDKVYAHGDISNIKFKNELVKFNSNEVGGYYGSCVFMRTSTGELHIGTYESYYKRFSSFDEVIFDPFSDEIVGKNGNIRFTTQTNVSPIGAEFYYVIKVPV